MKDTREHDQDVIDFVRKHGCVTSGRVMFFLGDHYSPIRWDSIDQAKLVLARLVLEERLITSTNGLVFRLPHGHHRCDSKYDIREAKRVGGMSVWGVVWHSGGESWSFDTYGLALDQAREQSGADVLDFLTKAELMHA